jgi:hypothetical protein
MLAPVRLHYNNFRSRFTRGAALVSALACLSLTASCGPDTSRSQTSVTNAAATPVQTVVEAANKFLGMLDNPEERGAPRSDPRHRRDYLVESSMRPAVAWRSVR